MALPKMKHSRKARNVHNVECPTRHCKDGNMLAQCSPAQDCGRRRKLPMCWFGIGSTGYSMSKETGYIEKVTNFYHYTETDMSCLPCCMGAPARDSPHMPSKILNEK